MKSRNVILCLAVVAAMAAVGGDFTSRITWETLSSFCHSNVADVKGPVRGIVVEHHGLGCIWFKPNEQKGWNKDLSEKGIVAFHPHYHPWCWMNDAAVRKAGRRIEYVISEGTGHCQLKPEARRRYNEAVLAAFDLK